MGKSWRETILLSDGKQKQINLKSWWADPIAQTNRAEFSARVKDEVPRMAGHQRFGGSKRLHDGGMKD